MMPRVSSTDSVVWVVIGRLGDLQPRHVVDVLDQIDAAGAGFGEPLAHGALDLGMAGVADQHHVAAGATVARDFQMDLGHQRTGGVEHLQAASGGLGAHRLRDAVGAEDDGGVVRHLVQFLHEHRAALAQVFDHEAVVHHLVADVDRGAEGLDGALDDLDGAVDAGAEAAGIGEDDFHAGIIPLPPASCRGR
jgi:hypothetical protein